ncbi:MAG: nucleotidyltransferase domain-containing protein [Thermoprotei archaeon]|jgi:predicted nucleotidyltransferase
MDIVEILIEERKLREKVFNDYINYAKKIKEIVSKEIKDFKLFVFGSVVRGDFHVMLSDIDIAIVTNEKVEDSRLKVKIEKELGLIGIFQIHIISEKIWNDWYLKLIDKYIEI